MQNRTPKRPAISKQAISIAARQTAINVIHTTCHCKLDVNVLSETIIRHWRFGMDAYQLAKTLESYSRYRPDIEMLYALEMMNRNVDALYNEQLKNWFNSQKITPPFPVGTVVKEGIIDSIDRYGIARYRIKQHNCKDADLYLLMNFEDVQWVSSPSNLYTVEQSRKYG